MAGTATAAGDGVAANPLRKGLATNRIADPCNVVFFGASGDLMKRMLMPAMWNLRLGDILPANYGIVGFSRSEYGDDEFRAEMRKSVDEFSRTGPAKDQLWNDFAQHVSYVSGDFDDVNCFHKLREQLEKNDKELGTAGNRLFYLSTPPSVFAHDRRPARRRRPGPAATTRPAGRASSSRSRSAPTSTRRARCRPKSPRSSTRSRSTGSTTTWARSRSRTSWRCASPTSSSSRSGTAATSTRCRSPRPRRSASSGAAATTTTPARCAT